jgi:hypothetical protein
MLRPYGKMRLLSRDWLFGILVLIGRCAGLPWLPKTPIIWDCSTNAASHGRSMLRPYEKPDIVAVSRD